MLTLRIAQNEAADELLSRDPLALVVGMMLDQQFPMERAFAAPRLLAIPQYLVVSILVGGGLYAGSQATNGHSNGGLAAGGLVGLLVLIAAIVLLFTARYPKPLYDLIVGLNRWALRVGAYAGLMTDRYPPFRLDQGGIDPGSATAVLTPPPPSGVPGGATPTAPAPLA